MPERNLPTLLNSATNRRLPLYAYLEPLFAGRRVLEVGCGPGAGADYLITHGAQRVVAIDTDPALVERARARYRRPQLDFRAVPHLGDFGAPRETFDVVIVPAADVLVRRGELVAAWKRSLVEGGRLLVSVTSTDHKQAGSLPPGQGVGYYELADALASHFPRVQLFGQTPFAGFGIVEFDGAAQGLRVDTRLVDGGAEVPSHYLAVAGTEQALELGYALVQVPLVALEAALAVGDVVEPAAATDSSANERRLEEAERKGRARLEEAEGRVAELRRRLDDVTAQSESAMRIARAQGEEMEELRGRLRRASEDRSTLDLEVTKLRNALTEADESVLALTRRTTEEMVAVAERLSSGFRSPAPADGGADRLTEYAALRDGADQLRATLAETEARASAAEQRLEEVATAGREWKEEVDDLRARLRHAEEVTLRERREVAELHERLRAADAEARKLEEREDALLERDERVAQLEGEKQDLTWRMAELEEKLRTAIGRVVIGESGRGSSEELTAARAARDRSLEEFRRAAAAHVEEVTRLKSSVSEQSALVSELEDALKVAEARAESSTAEATTLRKSAKELDEADRARRSRLAELEGKLLRLQHDKTAAAPAPESDELNRKLQALDRKLLETSSERDILRVQLEETKRALADSEAAARVRVVPHAPGTNGKDAVVASLPAVTGELADIAKNLRDELKTLSYLEATLQEEIDNSGRARDGVPGNGDLGGHLVEQGAEVILLHATLANFRRRAGRLRDETEGLRRRIESMSSSEISGFLEELGEDLAEFEK